jgi:uncharacterized membrane protein
VADWTFKVDGLFPIIWVMVASIVISMILERSRFKKYIPGPIFVMIIPCALGNLGMLPTQSPVYDSIGAIAIPVGVTLLLLRANIGEIIRSSGTMLPLFLLGCLGALVALAIVGEFMHFEDGAALWALSTALFIGAVLNGIATAQAIQADSTLVAAVIAANALVAPAYLAVLMFMMQSDIVSRFIGVKPGASMGSFAVAPKEAETKASTSELAPPLGHLIAVLYALGIYMLVDYVSKALQIQQYSILMVTVLAVLIPNVFPRARHFMSGAREMGMISMLMFIGVISVQIDLGALGFFSLQIMIFMTFVLAINLMFLLLIGRLFKADPHVLFLASLAGIGGATSTAAVAAAQGREDLVTPGILCALFGVVISTFIAVFGYQLLS